VREEPTGVRLLRGTVCDDNPHDRRVPSPDSAGEDMPCGLVAIGMALMFHKWGDAPKPSPAQLTALRHLHSDLGPALTSIDAIPNHTEDPALLQAAERVHDALRELLAEMAVVIYRARRRSRGEVSSSISLPPGGSR
jgi:hypothetical protein